MIRSSAPGKIILFGEHAVVYGRPALAVPVTQVSAHVKADARADFETDKRIWIDAPDIDLHCALDGLAPDHPIRYAIERVLNLSLSRRKRGWGEGLTLTITSTIPVASGLGSGAAVSVALIRAFASILHAPLTDDQVNQIAYDVEKIHHGTPSGIDNTVITYAKPVYFVKGQPIETFTVGAPFTIVIGDTGISAPTKESVGDVRKLWEADRDRWEKVFDQAGEIVEKAKASIESGRWRELGMLMNQNHDLLKEMTVSSPALDRLVETAQRFGALGSKMSGGGRGGNMIALVEADQAQAAADQLIRSGAKRTLITEVR
jgi:mevalonate kinase